jgi:hypothetical protein
MAGLEQEPEIDVKSYSWGGDGKPTKVARDMGWYRFTLPRAARRDGVDVLHCTSMRAPYRSAMPLVVTIHDAAVLRFPQTFNRWTRNYSATALPKVVRSADAIVTSSPTASARRSRRRAPPRRAPMSSRSRRSSPARISRVSSRASAAPISRVSSYDS